MNILELENYLDEINIKYFVADYFEGDDYEGYVCVFIKTDEFSSQVLVEIGFEKVKADLYIISLDKYTKIPEKYIEELRLKNTERFRIKNNNNEFRKRIVAITNLWKSIVNLYDEVNRYFFSQHSLYYFHPFQETVNWAFRLPLQLVEDNNSLEEFSYCLYQVGYECVNENTKNYVGKILKNKVPFLRDKKENVVMQYWKESLLENDSFYSDIVILRNYFKHIKGSRKELSREKCELMFRGCIERRNLKKLSNDYEYFIFQRNILVDFRNYLAKLDTIFKTHDIFKGENES